MRKLMLAALLTFVSSWANAQDNVDQNNLFKCVDNKSLALDNSCLSNKIENNTHFVEFQNKLNSDIADLGGNVMSTIIFYPELMQTRVIAHVDEPVNDKLVLHKQANDKSEVENY